MLLKLWFDIHLIQAWPFLEFGCNCFNFCPQTDDSFVDYPETGYYMTYPGITDVVLILARFEEHAKKPETILGEDSPEEYALKEKLRSQVKYKVSI